MILRKFIIEKQFIMRHFFFILILIVSIRPLLGQVEVTRYFDKDQLGIELLSLQWVDPPDDVKMKPYSNAFNLQYMITFVGINSNVALAIGGGVLTENYHIDSRPVKSQNKLDLIPIDEDINYFRNKIRFLTVELPLELRIRSNKNSRNKHWKLYLGGKLGYMFQSMHKYVGDNPILQEDNLKQKTYNLRYHE